MDYHWNDYSNSYFSIAQGCKSGGFNSTEFSPNTFEPETISNIEWGLKSRWWQQRVQVNLALFHFCYNDLQVEEFYAAPGESLPSYKISNGDARSEGLETEWRWQVNPHWQLHLYTEHLRSVWRHFVRHNIDGQTIDESGNRLFDAPRRSANIGFTVQYPLLSGASITLRGDTSYSDQRIENHALSQTTIAALSISNVYVAYQAAQHPWRVSLTVFNVFNKDYLLSSGGGLVAAIARSPVAQRGTPCLWQTQLHYAF